MPVSGLGFIEILVPGSGEKCSLGQGVSVVALNRNILISAAPVGSAYAIFDMQGKLLKKGRVSSANHNIEMSRVGNYLIRVGNLTQLIMVK